MIVKESIILVMGVVCADRLVFMQQNKSSKYFGSGLNNRPNSEFIKIIALCISFLHTSEEP